jgi:hypothetical protein
MFKHSLTRTVLGFGGFAVLILVIVLFAWVSRPYVKFHGLVKYDVDRRDLVDFE